MPARHLQDCSRSDQQALMTRPALWMFSLVDNKDKPLTQSSFLVLLSPIFSSNNNDEALLALTLLLVKTLSESCNDQRKDRLYNCWLTIGERRYSTMTRVSEFGHSASCEDPKLGMPYTINNWLCQTGLPYLEMFSSWRLTPPLVPSSSRTLPGEVRDRHVFRGASGPPLPILAWWFQPLNHINLNASLSGGGWGADDRALM